MQQGRLTYSREIAPKPHMPLDRGGRVGRWPRAPQERERSRMQPCLAVVPEASPEVSRADHLKLPGGRMQAQK